MQPDQHFSLYIPYHTLLSHKGLSYFIPSDLPVLIVWIRFSCWVGFHLKTPFPDTYVTALDSDKLYVDFACNHKKHLDPNHREYSGCSLSEENKKEKRKKNFHLQLFYCRVVPSVYIYTLLSTRLVHCTYCTTS